MRYSFKEFHFTPEQLRLAAPEKKENALTRISNNLNTLCLALTFHISLGLSARKTAFALRNVFSLKVSHQTILNYCELAAYYCHQFNLSYKGSSEAIQAGDESCIKVSGEKNYVFFFIAPKRRMITAYQIASNKDTLPATIAMKEALRTVSAEKRVVIFITDGNPAYQSAVHFLNQNQTLTINHKQVIGLQNLDSASEEFRPFKQLIERLFRTYKFHIKAVYGFKDFNGAVALTVLFVTHYNFLRPHYALNYEVPCPLEELKGSETLQGEWAKIFELATSLAA